MTTTVLKANVKLEDLASREDCLFVLDSTLTDFQAHIANCQTVLNSNKAKVINVVGKIEEIGAKLNNVYLHIYLVMNTDNAYSEETKTMVRNHLIRIQDMCEGTSILLAADLAERLDSYVLDIVQITDLDTLRQEVLSIVHEVQKHYVWTAHYYQHDVIKLRKDITESNYDCEFKSFDVFEQMNPYITFMHELEVTYGKNASNPEIQELLKKPALEGADLGKPVTVAVNKLKEDLTSAEYLQKKALKSLSKHHETLNYYGKKIGNLRIQLIVAKHKHENLFNIVSRLIYDELKSIEEKLLDDYRGYNIKQARRTLFYGSGLYPKTPKEAVRIIKSMHRCSAALNEKTTLEDYIKPLEDIIFNRNSHCIMNELKNNPTELKNYVLRVTTLS